MTIALCFLAACGGSGSGGNAGGGGQGNPPATPTGVSATAGNQQVSLTWTASATATSYHVKRGTTTGGPYTTVGSPTTTSYTDSRLTNGTAYYYVVSAVNSNGESGNSSEVSSTPTGGNPPATPTGVSATAGNQQVSLTWTVSATATSYHVKRGTTTGGPYTTVGSPTTTSYTDSGLTNGTAYYYVVSAVNSNGESGNSSEVSATPVAASTAVQATINVLANRHTISPYVYGGSFPASTAAITDSGTTVVRWGGNAASTYNWQLFTDNADNDYYFEDFNFYGLGGGNGTAGADGNSTQFITDVKAAGSAPLMTMVMLPWVAQSQETAGTTGNLHWSFPETEYPNQCSFDQYNNDAGNGIVAGTCNSSSPTYITATQADLNRTYFPLLDDNTQTCPSGTTCVYRKDWATALATAFGSNTCLVPYSTITSCHFYDMDNEIDIWGGTHRDVHPNPSGYDELSTTYWTEATNLKTWDPQAVRLGPVSCCWWFYWNGANSNDKPAHAGIDFLPWWLNEVYWQDQIAGTRSLDMFDIHAYPDGPDTSGYSQAQKQALAVSIYRDYWDPTLVSPSGTIDQPYTTQIQPNKTIAFRIPRMRAIVNSIYPGTPLAMTEWSAAFAGESDFSTALGDADAYGLLGRERVGLASRWTAPSAANPNYQALKLFTNYDGAHHGFGTTSVAATHNANPDLFSIYAALNSAGTQMTVMVLNKDPQNAAQLQFATTGFTPTNYVSYTLSQGSPTAIVASSSQSWASTQTFAPYTATLLVVSGSVATSPSSEWDLNPDTIMVPASGTVTLNPVITKGSANVTMSSAAFDSYEGAAACTGGTMTLTTATITPTINGEITVNTGATPGFCHFTVTGSDGTATQTQGGWIVVGNPAATLTQTSGNNQTGAVGSTLASPLTVTVSPGQSGGSAAGASILFTASAGSLTYGSTSGAKVIAITNGSGVASVTLTLPANPGVVTVTAEGPYGLGHPVAASFTETAQ
ncbi:MAG TPA: glycoside hydrolase family 44 protein [Candidatus Acidoferrales bacterium]|nr:glycoside hydrolase family 44 protein [Candidatus Acidoferrales bacterium]